MIKAFKRFLLSKQIFFKMKKLFSAKYSEDSHNISLLVLRLGIGSLLAYHGYHRIINFNSEENISLNFVGMGTTVSQTLVIVVELLGGLLVLTGLCTRLAAIAVIGWLGFVLIKSFGFSIFGNGEKVWLLLIGYITILIAGAGRYSFDKLIERKISTI